MTVFIELLASLLLLTGGIFLLVGSVGLARLPDFLTRLHAPTKATTLGIGMLLIASMVMISFNQGSLSVHELMIIVFIMITAPISAHMLAKVAFHLRLKTKDNTINQEYMDSARERRPPKL